MAQRRPQNNDFSFTDLLVGAGFLGATYMVGRHLLNGQQSEHAYENGAFGPRKVDIVSNPTELERVMRKLKRDAADYNALGFDCETTVGGNKVDLLQLATADNYCVLVRLCDFDSVPISLKQLLSDEKIIKVGVDAVRDAEMLERGYGINVTSTLDLRFMAKLCDLPARGLKEMSSMHLNIQYESYDWTWNWNSGDLDEDQIEYAANDAHAGIRLFEKFDQNLQRREWFASFETVRSKIKPYLNKRYTQ